jgi:hypothetical protein
MADGSFKTAVIVKGFFSFAARKARKRTMPDRRESDETVR